MATVQSLMPRLAERIEDPDNLFRGSVDEDSVATLSLMARQFGDAAGAAGTALMLQDEEGRRSGVLSLDGDCVRSGAPVISASDAGATEWTQSEPGGRHWLLRRFPLSLDGRAFVLMATLFNQAKMGARVVADAERRFQPMIAGVTRLWGRDRAARRNLGGYAAALNHAGVGVILLDGNADILFANHAAAALLDSGQGVRRRRQSITASDLTEAVKLQIAIDHVIAGGDAAGTKARRTPMVALDRGSNHRPLLVTVLPPSEQAAGECDVAAILYLCDPQQDIRPLMSGVCRYYRLSPVETRLALELAVGLSLTESAEALKIKEQTARSYLKQIFIKTGTRRQGELIRVLLTSMSRTSGKMVVDLI